MTLTETAIQTVTKAVAEKLNSSLRYWTATAGGDTAGSYISLTRKKNPDNQNRRLFLDVVDEKDDENDLVRYCWHYWNVNRAQWHVSDLSTDANMDEIIDFLVRHLEAE